jgi:hypothetical protein
VNGDTKIRHFRQKIKVVKASVCLERNPIDWIKDQHEKGETDRKCTSLRVPQLQMSVDIVLKKCDLRKQLLSKQATEHHYTGI